MLLSVPQEPGCSLQSAAWHSHSIDVWCVKEHIPLPHSFNVHAWRHLFECASPACLPHPPVADVTPRGCLPTVGRGTALTSLSFLVLWKHLRGFTLWDSSTTFTVSKHLSYPPSSVSSPNLKNPCLHSEKNKTQTKIKIQIPNPTQAPWQKLETIVFYACSKWHLSHSGFRNVQFPWFHIATAGFVLSKR